MRKGMNCFSRNLYNVLILLFIMQGLSAQPYSRSWVKNRPLRIYHPNMREIATEDFDKLIRDCKAIHAEAIVLSVGSPEWFFIDQPRLWCRHRLQRRWLPGW